MADEGMDRAAAEALAAHVAEVTTDPTLVEPEGAYFVVNVQTATRGTFTLRDEADWDWLRPILTPG